MPTSLVKTAALVILAVSLLVPHPLRAAGQETLGRDQDIVLSIDSRWPGNAYGGYLPLRIKLANMGAPRTLTLVFEELSNGSDNALPTVSRTVQVEQQATVNFSLSIPMVSPATEGVLRVYDNGYELKGLTARHSLPGYGGHYPRASLLVISSEGLDDKLLQPFEDAAATECAKTSGLLSGGGPGYGGRHSGSSSVSERDHVVLQPSQNLPVNWIDYSGVDLVAVDWRDWKTRLSAAEREAILKWTASGGVLMVYGTGKPAAQVPELNKSLQLEGDAAREWTECLPENHVITSIITAASLHTGVLRGTMTVTTTTVEEEQSEVNGWEVSPGTYSHRDWTLGKIYVFPQTPFPGTAHDWSWWLTALPKNLSQWPEKMGMSARSGNSEFLNFLIPGVGSVPVVAFLTLITMFTFIIGPLNYYLLKKRRRLAAMVVTVPLIAGVTCLLLFAYSMVADGFSIRSRVQSFTWLDQHRKSAISFSRLCLYAPFAPSAGLKFSPECAVFPIWQQSQGFDSGNLDWSGNDQRLTSGWFRSQTWTQFETVENRDERGRLDFTPPTDPKAAEIQVSNGLSWDLEYLAVHVGQDRWYAGEDVKAGATARLKRVEPTEMSLRMGKSIEKHAWNFPAGTSSNTNSPYSPYSGGYHRGGFYDRYLDLPTVFGQGLLQRSTYGIIAPTTGPQLEFQDWRDGRNQSAPPVPHAVAAKPHYRALLRRNPGIQIGVKSAVDSQSLHLLFGNF